MNVNQNSGLILTLLLGRAKPSRVYPSVKSSRKEPVREPEVFPTTKAVEELVPCFPSPPECHAKPSARVASRREDRARTAANSSHNFITIVSFFIISLYLLCNWIMRQLSTRSVLWGKKKDTNLQPSTHRAELSYVKWKISSLLGWCFILCVCICLC